MLHGEYSPARKYSNCEHNLAMKSKPCCIGNKTLKYSHSIAVLGIQPYNEVMANGSITL